MEYLPTEECSKNVGKILCCECGVLIDPNPANMCVGCLRTKVDITEPVPKQVIIYFCKGCERYLEPPNKWISCALESRELLFFCLKKLKGLNQLRLVDATFDWTEPHSRRINVRLTVQKEVMGGAILQQVFVVQFVVNTQMCNDCHKQDSAHYWKAVVQIRQRVKHKKTFLYLEQLILKHNMHSNCINIKTIGEGLDFFFAKRDDARKLVDFFCTMVPCRYGTSQQLISHDTHSNTYNYKYTFAVEIVPVCKNDVVCLPVSLSRSLGNIGQLCIVSRVTNSIHLIDPFTLQTAEVNNQQYWRNPFHAIGSLKEFTEYTVMNIDNVMDCDKRNFTGQGPVSFKHVLADVWVVRSCDLGITDTEIHTRTHIGHLLKPGDLALGLDLSTINVNHTEFNKLNKDNLPDVILVKKVYADSMSRRRKRKWKLKRLDLDDGSEASNRDYDEFLDDIEQDPVFRQNVDIYKNPCAVDTDEMEDDGVPHITLQEMLEDLTLDVNVQNSPMMQ